METTDSTGRNKDTQELFAWLRSVPSENVNFWVGAYINSGADVDGRDYKGRTPLHIAVSRDNTAAVEMLIEHGANPNLASKNGVTPIDAAARTGLFHSLFYMLREAKPESLNRQDAEGRTSLHWAAIHRFETHVLEWMIDKGADPSVCNQRGYLPSDLLTDPYEPYHEIFNGKSEASRKVLAVHADRERKQLQAYERAELQASAEQIAPALEVPRPRMRL